jgi:hypothetical protein
MSTVHRQPSLTLSFPIARVHGGREALATQEAHRLQRSHDERIRVVGRRWGLAAGWCTSFKLGCTLLRKPGRRSPTTAPSSVLQYHLTGMVSSAISLRTISSKEHFFYFMNAVTNCNMVRGKVSSLTFTVTVICGRWKHPNSKCSRLHEQG